jgi:hypothetical protein
MYLLDTNVISETRKPRPHGAVLAWIASTPSDQLSLSAVTIGELQCGVERVRKYDMAKAAEINDWIDHLDKAFEIIAPDGPIFRGWAALMKSRANNAWEDALIAATARNRGMIVATRNLQDFNGLGIEVFNPFTFKS